MSTGIAGGVVALLTCNPDEVTVPPLSPSAMVNIGSVVSPLTANWGVGGGETPATPSVLHFSTELMKDVHLVVQLAHIL